LLFALVARRFGYQRRRRMPSRRECIHGLPRIIPARLRKWRGTKRASVRDGRHVSAVSAVAADTARTDWASLRWPVPSPMGPASACLLWLDDLQPTLAAGRAGDKDARRAVLAFHRLFAPAGSEREPCLCCAASQSPQTLPGTLCCLVPHNTSAPALAFWICAACSTGDTEAVQQRLTSALTRCMPTAAPNQHHDGAQSHG